ncbi:MAG: flagellar hook-length control protein FliK [Rickettsiales bacterium]|nr:flagellar hook-length control protein FliK [Rickettsiales bacterium]
MDIGIVSLLANAPAVPPQNEKAADALENKASDKNPFNQLLSAYSVEEIKQFKQELLSKAMEGELEELEQVLEQMFEGLVGVSLTDITIPDVAISAITSTQNLQTITSIEGDVDLPIVDVSGLVVQHVAPGESVELDEMEAAPANDLHFLLLTPQTEELSGFPMVLPINESASKQLLTLDAQELQDWVDSEIIPVIHGLPDLDSETLDVFQLTVELVDGNLHQDAQAWAELHAEGMGVVVSPHAQLVTFPQAHINLEPRAEIIANEIMPAGQIMTDDMPDLPLDDLDMIQQPNIVKVATAATAAATVTADVDADAGMPRVNPDERFVKVSANDLARSQRFEEGVFTNSANANNGQFKPEILQQTAANVFTSVDVPADAEVEILTPINASGHTSSLSAKEVDEARVPFYKAAHFVPSHAQSKPSEQVQMFIRQGIQPGMDRVMLELDPQDLGKVEIRMDIVADGRSQVSFTAENRSTLEMLQKDAAWLQKALQEAGIEADTQDMEFQLSDQGNGDGKGGGESGTSLAYGEEQNDVLPSYTSQYVVNLEEGVDIKV